MCEVTENKDNSPILYKIKRKILLWWFPLARKLKLRQIDSINQNIQDEYDAWFAS